MTNFVPLKRSEHAGKVWRRFNSYCFASAHAVVPLVGAEFGKAAASMPIAFVDPFVKWDHAAAEVLFAGRFGSKMVLVSSMAQATASNRSAIERSARP